MKYDNRNKIYTDDWLDFFLLFHRQTKVVNIHINPKPPSVEKMIMCILLPETYTKKLRNHTKPTRKSGLKIG